MSKVTVLGVVRELAFHANRERVRTLGPLDAGGFAQQANESIAAIEELIEADKAYDVAKAAYFEAIRPPNSHAPVRALKHGNPILRAFMDATARRKTALDRMEGAQ